MENEEELGRYKAKTAEQRFLQVLQQDFRYPSRIAGAILEEAQTCLQGKTTNTHTGQMRVLLAHGQALSETRQVEVTWKVDGGAVLEKHDLAGLRPVHIQRLLDEGKPRKTWPVCSRHPCGQSSAILRNCTAMGCSYQVVVSERDWPWSDTRHRPIQRNKNLFQLWKTSRQTTH